MRLPWLYLLLACVPLVCFLLPVLLARSAAALGWYIQKRTLTRRQLLVARTEREAKQLGLDVQKETGNEDDEWEKVESQGVGSTRNGGAADRPWKGIVGFFHPFCNAGGGGERVLWAAIRATQKRWPDAICVVYTGDTDVDKDAILKRVQERFNIYLHAPTVHFLFLTTRHWVQSTTWPHFTLLGQSLGSLILGLDAFSLLVPDVFVDTMGYAFTLALCKLLFPAVPTGAYVHYPTISTDMLGSLDKDGQGVNAEAGMGTKGAVKRKYWHLFASLYGWVGGSVDVVMTNSSWTQHHINSIWASSRSKGKLDYPETSVVFPPVAVEELEREVEISAESEKKRGPYLLYIAQFRPEKNHTLILQAFASMLATREWKASKKPQLVLIGSVRDSDDATRVYRLRLLAHELQIKDSVEFVCDATWPQILEWLQKSSVGVNGMWNEHFGIGVVEYQAAGLISVVNDSGGPKEDIVVPVDSGRTGFHATTVDEYADAFAKALTLSSDETLTMRLRARESARRFTEHAFASKWIEEMEKLVELEQRLHRGIST